MVCDFTSFSIVFHSCQDDGRMIMNGCVQFHAKLEHENFPAHEC